MRPDFPWISSSPAILTAGRYACLCWGLRFCLRLDRGGLDAATRRGDARRGRQNSRKNVPQLNCHDLSLLRYEIRYQSADWQDAE